MKKNLILLCAALFAAVMFFPVEARPCSCSWPPSVLDEFERVENVIVAKVTDVKDRGEAESNLFSVPTVTTIVKVYKGGFKSGEEVEFISSGTSCDYQFHKEDVGKAFLLCFGPPFRFVPSDNPENVFTSPQNSLLLCGRTRALDDATEDILYLDNISKVKGKTRISGQVTNYSDGSKHYPGDGMKIMIRQDDKKWELTTDSKGVFEIYDLLAGEYEVETEPPDKWRVYVSRASSTVLIRRFDGVYIPKTDGVKNTVLLEEGKHVSLEIGFIPDAAISGRILSPSGQPVQNLLVDLVSIDGKNFGGSGRTDTNGEFNVKVLNIGECHLVVNRYNVISEETPFRRFYFPGVADIEKAKVFSITPGVFFDDIILRIPEFEEMTKISVEARYSNGKAAEQATIDFSPKEAGVLSDSFNFSRYFKNGKYHISLPKGVAGKLSGTIIVDNAALLDCPEKIDGRTFTMFHSEEVLISGKEDGSEDIRLQFPVNPYCE